MNVVFFHITVISLLLISCGFYNTEIIDDNQKEKNLVSMEMVKQILEDQISIQRQEPFIIREFDPYLNGKWIGKAVSYGFYRKGQAPGGKGPNEEQILEDLEIILNYWNLIRIYGSDENSEKVLRVIRKNNLPVKVMLGVWLEDDKDNSQREKENIAEVLNAIRLANEYSEIISAINVGNETQVFWSAHKMDMEKLIHYIRVIRNNTNVPVTTADDYNFWNKHESKSVADEVDFIVVHIYPLWNGQTLDN
jgi:exo-beta-1,3-glucanase (GH17 family)